MTKDYNVGYRKPPVETRFKKGQSGNPQGRRPGSKNLSTLVREVMSETVTVNENGRRRKVSKAQAAFTQQANKAASGDLRAIKLMSDLMAAAEALDPPERVKTQTPEEVRKEDEKILKAVLARISGGEDDDSQ